MKKIILFNIILLASLVEWSCEDALDLKPPTELDKGTIQTEDGITALLYSSYRQIQNSTPSRWLINNSEVNTDIGLNSGGTEFLTMSQIINFTWDASLGTFQADVWA